MNRFLSIVIFLLGIIIGMQIISYIYKPDVFKIVFAMICAATAVKILFDIKELHREYEKTEKQ